MRNFGVFMPFQRSKSLKKNLHTILGKNCRLFHILVKFLFTTIEIELDYYHQKVNVQIASWVSKRFKT